MLHQIRPTAALAKRVMFSMVMSAQRKGPRAGAATVNAATVTEEGSGTLSSDIQNRPTRPPTTKPPTLAAGPRLLIGQEKRAATETPPPRAAPALSVISEALRRKPVLVKTPF